MLRHPLFITSLGNPPPIYRNTLHSVGHTLLSFIQESLVYPPFAKSQIHAGGLLSCGDDFTLWQSPAFMNVSGPAVAIAWKAFLRDLSSEERTQAKLVIIHDELESQLGKIKVKVGGSAKGHNGLKSCGNSLGAAAFIKIGVGIGRPESRQSNDVAQYVLRKMSSSEIVAFSNGVDEILEVLAKIRND